MGCGNSQEQKKDQDKKYDGKGQDLAGKQKFISDVGAVIMHIEERKQQTALLLSFVPIQPANSFNGLSLVYYVIRTGQVYAIEYTDAELEELKTTAAVTFGWSAIFKSIASDFMKNKAKVTVTPESVVVNVEVASVKDKNTQKISFKLPVVPTVGSVEKFKYVTEPLARVVLKKRQQTEEREREIKYSRMQSLMVVHDASMGKHKAVVDRVMKIIVPLREESARHAKSSAELSAKIASHERKIKALQRTKEQNPLDAMYEKGGARSYLHLPFAEEHVPKEHTPAELQADTTLDYVGALFPYPPEMTLEQAVARPPTDPRLVSFYEKAPKDVVEPMLMVFSRLDSWDMSVFELEKATHHNALFYVTYAMLYKLNLVNHFKLDDAILRNFLAAVQSGYHPNPYHNSTHAADVAQINYYIMTQGGLVDKCKLSKEELLAGVLAGAIHDYDHPGFNNNFHTRTNAYLSTLYNDRSILENHHCACVYEMLRMPKYNIFAHFTEEQKREVRDTMLEMVLSTDMGNHARIFGSFRRKQVDLADGPWADKEDRRLALSMSIKMADISNCGRPSHLYLEWAKNIAAEFYIQGDAEASLGLSISPFMDRKKGHTEFPSGQVSFMKFIVIPMFEAISEFLPSMEFCLNHCFSNRDYWKRYEEL